MLLAVTPVAASQTLCEPCVRGDALIEKFALHELRALAPELATLPLGNPLTAEQYARIIALRQRSPMLVRIGAVDDADLPLVAAALCRAPSDACTTATTRALRCLADRCAVALPDREPKQVDVTVLPEPCRRGARRKRSSALGVGLDWGTGVQRSRHPNDGRVWSLGIETRMRVTPRLGLVARVDRFAGRDEATDIDDNGIDDLSTGSITRISALAGPSVILDHTPFEGSMRFLRLDLLGGYVGTRSQAGENGPAAGLDLGYQLSVFRIGARVVQGFGDARDATMVLAHLGISGGTTPVPRDGTDCTGETVNRSSRLALGFDFPLGGYGVSSQLGYLATGLGIEAIYHLTRTFDVAARGDLLVFPGDERDRVLHHAVLGGLRVDHGSPGRRSSRVGFFTTAMVGYTHGAGLTPTTAGTGPIVDLSLAWGGQGREGAGYLRLHGRAGISPDNVDYIALFLSAGFELRFDPSRWRDRI